MYDIGKIILSEDNVNFVISNVNFCEFCLLGCSIHVDIRSTEVTDGG